MRKRTAARELALQALYQWDMQGDDFEARFDDFLNEWSDDADTANFARELTLGCRMWLDQVDDAIRAAARNWTLERMARVDRQVLRLGAYELLFRDDIPPHVSINEAVDLAKKFGAKESGAFVNGVLDRIKVGHPKTT